ncbi:MAG: pitrilysin family protein [Stygiobacter sp.]
MKNINITTLDNGIKIVTEKLNYVQSFSLGFWFNVGSRDENENNNGISHFIEHMLFKGTKRRSAKRISEEIESLGGYLNAFTSKEHTCFYGRGLKDNIAKTFEVLADMTQNPLFASEEIKKESSVVIDELYDIEDSPDELIFDKFESNVFNGNSLAFPIIGTEKNISSFTKKDLFNYINENYTVNNFLIVASGNVDHNEIIKLAEKYLKKNFKKSENKKRTLNLSVASDLFVEKDTQQVHYILGKPTYGYNNVKRISVAVLSHILGEGSSSRLFQKLREEHGISYQINTFLNSFYDISTFGVYLSTNDKTVKKAEELVLNEVKNICNKKVNKQELDRAKEYLIGNMLMSLESTTNRMNRIANQILYYDKIIHINDTIKKIKSVTKEEILELSNEIFNSNDIANGSLTRVILSSKNFLLDKAA